MRSLDSGGYPPLPGQLDIEEECNKMKDLSNQPNSQSLFVAMYTDDKGVDQFAYYGSWGQGKIRWYKTRKMGEKMIAEILADKYNKNKPPANTRIVEFKKV